MARPRAVVERLGALDTSWRCNSWCSPDAVCEALLDLPGTDAACADAFRRPRRVRARGARARGGGCGHDAPADPRPGRSDGRLASGPWSACRPRSDLDAAVAGRPVLPVVCPVDVGEAGSSGVLALGFELQRRPGATSSPLLADRHLTSRRLSRARRSVRCSPALNSPGPVIQHAIATVSSSPSSSSFVHLKRVSVVGFQALHAFDDQHLAQLVRRSGRHGHRVSLEHATVEAGVPGGGPRPAAGPVRRRTSQCCWR